MSSVGDIWRAAAWPDGWTVHHVAETASTNTDLLAALESGVVGDRAVLVADHQTAGRGRLDRRWDAPPGTNLLVSIAVAPAPVVASEVTQRVGLAALAAARSVRPRATLGLKWPNDVLLDGAKLAGVLAQRSSRVDGVVVGLGLNIGWAPEGAARLGDAGDTVAPAEVLRRVLVEYDRLPSDLAAAYRAALSTLGRRVRIDLPDGGDAVGVATDLDRSGRLVVTCDDGRMATFDVGDVVHLRDDPR